MEARFERMMSRNIELENKFQTQLNLQSNQVPTPNEQDKKNILASDASSQAQQSNPKRQDSKATPIKNHPMSDVMQLQNP